MNKSVFLDYVESYNIDEVKKAIIEAFDILKVNGEFKPKMKVLLKVCLPGPFSPDSAYCTHPAVVTAVANVLEDMGVSSIIADSPYGKYKTSKLEEVYLTTGMIEVANLTTAELNYNLSTTKLEIPDGKRAKSLTLLDVVNDVDLIINIGKLKVDETFGYMGVCSNIFGLVPGDLKTLVLNRLPEVSDYNNYIIDMLEGLKNKLVLHIIDGVVSIEAGKSPRMLSMIGASTDPYALDSAVLDVLGMEYRDSILKQATLRDLCDIEKPYRTVGEKVEKFIVEDFAIVEVENNNLIDKDKGGRKRFFRANQRRVKIDGNVCKGCGVCSKVCPAGAIKMKYDNNGELFAEVDYDKCIFCFKCHTACPYEVVDIQAPAGYKKLEKEINKYNEEN